MRNKIVAVVVFLIFMFLYIIPSLIFPVDKEYYDSLIKPFYAPPKIVFSITWGFLFILLSIYFTILFINDGFKRNLIYFMIHYLSLFYYPKMFFIEKDLFVAIVLCVTAFLSGFMIFITTYKENRKLNSLLIPYLAWTLFATIMQIHFYFLN